MTKFHSGLEELIAKQLDDSKLNYRFEELRIYYNKEDNQKSFYRPDFVLENGIIVEVKGQFVTKDRKKHKLIRKQYGDKYDIRFVFSNPNQKVGKKSNTSYADWCNLYGFKYSNQKIPQEWLKERKIMKRKTMKDFEAELEINPYASISAKELVELEDV